MVGSIVLMAPQCPYSLHKWFNIFTEKIKYNPMNVIRVFRIFIFVDDSDDVIFVVGYQLRPMCEVHNNMISSLWSVRYTRVAFSFNMVIHAINAQFMHSISKITFISVGYRGIWLNFLNHSLHGVWCVVHKISIQKTELNYNSF